jgi:hypothetical protein
MNDWAESHSGTRRLPWRAIGWGGAVVLLALPFIAMQLQAPGVNWTLGDFIFAGVLFAIVGGLAELGVRMAPGRHYRSGFFLGLLGMFVVIWGNLAVGIVGSEDNSANNLFFLSLLVGIGGAAVVRLRARGMSIAMFATALALWAAFAIAASGPTDEPFGPHLREFVGISLFACLFVASGLLFRRAAAQ